MIARQLSFILSLLCFSSFATAQTDDDFNMSQRFKNGDAIEMNMTNKQKTETAYSEPGLSYSICQQRADRCDSQKAGWLDKKAKVKLNLLDSKGRPSAKGQPAFADVQQETNMGIVTRRYYKVTFEYDTDKGKKTGEGWVPESYLRIQGTKPPMPTKEDIVKKPEPVKKEQPIKKEQPKDPPKKEEPKKPVSSKKDLECECAPGSKPVTKPPPPPALKKDMLQTFSDIADKAEAYFDENVDVEAFMKETAHHFGQCAVDIPLNAKPKNWDSKKTVYGQSAYKKLPTSGHNPKANANIQKAANRFLKRKVTDADLANIDVVARTLYAEMATCFDDGIQFPTAVAKILVNRASYNDGENPDNKPIDQFNVSATKYSADLPTMTEVALAKRQFIVWDQNKLVPDPKRKGKFMPVFNKSGLEHSLCPPAIGSDQYWAVDKKTGKRIPTPPREKEIWAESLKIASDAVLNPTKFEDSTSDLKSYFYTSGKNYSNEVPKKKRINFNGMDPLTERKSPEIDGATVYNPTCINLYNGFPK